MTINLKIELTSNAFEKRSESQVIEAVANFVRDNPKPVQAKMENGYLKEVFLIQIEKEPIGVITQLSEVKS